MSTLQSGQRLGAYEVVAPLAAGGMGGVYRARDTRLERPVAIKVLPASIAGSAEALARFEREARAVAALSHPNILAIYDFGHAPEATYAVMELLDSETTAGPALGRAAAAAQSRAGCGADRERTRGRPLAEGFNEVRGVAWSADGGDVWYAASTGETGSGMALFDSPLSGGRRIVYAAPTSLRLFDIARDGRVLLGSDANDRRVEAMLSGDATAREITLRDDSTGSWVAPDGSAATLSDQAVAGYSAYLLRAGAALPVRLGPGQAFAMSPDGRWVAAMPANQPRVLLHSPGAAASRELPNPDRIFVDSMGWLPDGAGLAFFGQPSGDCPADTFSNCPAAPLAPSLRRA